jgi:hypothetical protein
MSSSVGKRQRERQKLERAQAKTERRAARQAAAGQATDALSPPSPRSESELIGDLSALHRAFDADEVSLEDFEARRGRIQEQFEELLR